MGDANQRWADADAGVGVATVGVGLGVGVSVGVGVTDAVGVGVAEAVGVGVQVGVAVVVGTAVKVGVPSAWWFAEVGAPPTARYLLSGEKFKTLDTDPCSMSNLAATSPVSIFQTKIFPKFVSVATNCPLGEQAKFQNNSPLISKY